MKLSQLMLTAMLMTAATSTFVAAAEDTHHSMKGHAAEKAAQRREGTLRHLLAGIELTETQKQQIKALSAQHRAAAQAAGTASRNQLQQLMAADNFDELSAKQLLQQRQEQKQQRRLQRLKLQHQIMQLLTAEQQDQVKANLAKQAKGRHGQKHS